MFKFPFNFKICQQFLLFLFFFATFLLFHLSPELFLIFKFFLLFCMVYLFTWSSYIGTLSGSSMVSAIVPDSSLANIVNALR